MEIVYRPETKFSPYDSDYQNVEIMYDDENDEIVFNVWGYGDTDVEAVNFRISAEDFLSKMKTFMAVRAK